MDRVLFAFLCSGAGAITGGLLGVGIAILSAPARDPRQPVAHEWYIVAAALFVISGAVAGWMLGLLIGSFARRIPTIAGLVGAAVGGGVGLVLSLCQYRLDEYGGLNAIIGAFLFGFVATCIGGAWSGKGNLNG